jgi:hypothetical protein
MRIAAVLATVMLVTTVPAFGGGGLVVHLAPPQQIVKRGDSPRFVVTVEAASALVRVMKFGKRGDLRDNYARLVVTRNGMPVEVPRVISDPGPTSAGDYIDLALGKSMSFTHTGSPFALSELPPGTYSAVVRLQADWTVEPVESNAVSFQVGTS